MHIYLWRCIFISLFFGASFSFGTPEAVSGPEGTTEKQIRLRIPPEGLTMDLERTILWTNWGGPYGEDTTLPAGKILPRQTAKLRIVPNKNQYPLILEGESSGTVTVRGGRFMGVQHRDLTWRVMKLLYDGCGALVMSSGLKIFENMHIENIMDALRPAGTGYFVIRDTYARYIRDDFVENDQLLAGEITDCLIDGCHVFLSEQRSKKNTRPSTETNVVVVKDTVARIMAMPYDIRDEGKKKIVSPDGKGVGMIFKWMDSRGTVEVTNCVFLVDGMGANGPRSMRFPSGTYRNVTLVWLGDGDYPAPIPAGVTVTRDRKTWESARRSWFERRNLPILPEPK